MSTSSALLKRSAWRPQQPFVCAACLRQRRRVSTSWLNTQKAAEEAWNLAAVEIRARRRQSMLETLDRRGYVHDVTGPRSDLNKLLTSKRTGFYVGVDPTAASLHLGHMLPLMMLFWLHLHGYKTVTLLGASTSGIGDPTGRTTSRPEMTSTERKANIASIHYQLKKLWSNLEKVGAKHGYEWDKSWSRAIVSNATWWNKLPFLEVMKYLGKGLRVGAMLGKDTVKTKMESGEGISLAEFCYPVMQAWDWWNLYTTRDVQIQIGGSDQWGNITAGIDAIKYMKKTHPDPLLRGKSEDGVDALTMPWGMTVPLLTTASGDKFGKSAGNAIWLDAEMTSVFDLYGFFVRSADADVERYLQLFTFLPLKAIKGIMKRHTEDPSKRHAQHLLAREFVELVHGSEKAQEAAKMHEALFSKPTLSTLLDSDGSVRPAQKAVEGPESTPDNPLKHNQNPATRQQGEFVSSKLNKFAPQTDQNNAPTKHIVLPVSLVKNRSIARVLHSAGLVTSRSEGHRLAQHKGAYIGSASADNEQMSDQLSYVPAKLQDPMQTWRYVIRDYRTKHHGANEPGAMDNPNDGEEGLLILRVGKWKVRICRIVSDEKFESMNIDPPPPGWVEFKAEQVAERSKGAYEDLGVDEMRPKRGAQREAFMEGQQKGRAHFENLERERKQEQSSQNGRSPAEPEWLSCLRGDSELDKSRSPEPGPAAEDMRDPEWVRTMRRELEEENARIKELEDAAGR